MNPRATPESPGRFLKKPSERELANRHIRLLVFSYFWLLIFEGALRKWFLPSLATPLLLIRDPVVIAAYFIAFRAGVFPSSMAVRVIAAMSIFGLFLGGVQIVLNQELTLLVIFYGLRTSFLQLPFILLIPMVIRQEDLERIGKWTLILAVPMLLLMYAQYFSPSGHFLNKATSAEVKQIAFEGSKVRPSGTFSFATGPASFFPMVAAFAMGMLNSGSKTIRLLALTGVVVSVAALPVSGSRMTVGMMAIVLLGGVVLLALNRRTRKQAIWILVAGVAGFSILAMTPAFQEAMTSMQNRVTSAGQVEGAKGGFLLRIMGGFLAPVSIFGGLDVQSFLLGNGIGLGTSAGSALLTGARGFLLSEGEWGRLIMEMGWIFGTLYIGMRFYLAAYIGHRSFRQLGYGFSVPFLLFLANIWQFLQGQMGQATNQGFMILLGGLALISLRPKIAGEASRVGQQSHRPEPLASGASSGDPRTLGA